VQPAQIVVFDAVGHDGRRDGAIHPGRNLQPQFNRVGKRRLEAAADGRAHLLGEPVRKLERHQHLVVPYEGDDAKPLGREDLRGECGNGQQAEHAHFQ
jgi:hypothetical protein